MVPGGTELLRHSCGRLSCVTPVSPLLSFLHFRKITDRLLMVWIWLPTPSVTSNLSVLVISNDLHMHPFIYPFLQEKGTFSSAHFIILLHPAGTSHICLQRLVTRVPWIAGCHLWMYICLYICTEKRKERVKKRRQREWLTLETITLCVCVTNFSTLFLGKSTL